MLLANPEVSAAQIEGIILADYGEIAQGMGYNQADVAAAFAPGRSEDTYATLNVRGIPFSSFRFQTGVLTPADCSRGGDELSPGVTGIKVFHKSLGMQVKHALDGSDDIGGKSGIAATPEELDEIGLDGRWELFGQHALAHNINPFTNITATDIGSNSRDMDAIAAALSMRFGDRAGAAASGVSERYGGEPDIHMLRTGLGASIYTDRYLRSIAPQQPRVAEAISGGEPLRVLIQGLGKAGAHFLRTMPRYMQPIGALEHNGGIVAKGGGYLDRTALLQTARTNGLDITATKNMADSRWLPPDARAELWATSGAELLVPAFDENQVDGDDIETFAQDGDGIAVIPIANYGVTPEGHKVADELEMDVLPFAAVNIGGTVSSKLIGEKILGNKWWTRNIYETRWNGTMVDIANRTLAARTKLSVERGRFVSFDQTVGAIIVRHAVGRLHHLRGQHV